MRYIDLSHTIEDSMPVYPGDSEVILKQINYQVEDSYNAFSFSTNLHAGTHIDCPLHLFDQSKTIADYPLQCFAGNGCLIDARGMNEIDYVEEFEDQIQKGDVVLLYTGFDKLYGTGDYYNKHPVITERLANYLVSREIKMIGMDMPSPDYSPFSIHKLLLAKGIFMIENLTNLEQLLNVNNFEVFAQPLKINAEASLTRAFARCV